jgi:methyl-accepting chemotaxis protein
VEQVNGAVANVAQVSREAESSTTQAAQTASELATLSRRLMQLIRAEAKA